MFINCLAGPATFEVFLIIKKGRCLLFAPQDPKKFGVFLIIKNPERENFLSKISPKNPKSDCINTHKMYGQTGDVSRNVVHPF